ncbi:transposase, Ptta/En/Spm [Artemisia annua]|uniref:Transposase, Ptta/En/Spm n=1 Tax=Artemisia annua TaxID=35608 RepID=A0A2U1NHY3_ARTAN|nr:transposase, Ptta/En/Spm [Artemisia annua]
MDKSWILSDRLSEAYEEGVNAFLEFAKLNNPNSNAIPCPCVNCINLCHTSIKNVRYHVFKHGFDENYIDWTFHGEASSKDEADQCPNESRPPEFDYTKEMLHDAFTYAENEPNLLMSLLEECDKPLNVKQYLKQYDKMMNKRLKTVEDELARRRCASTNASEGASNSPTLSDEDEPPNVPSERNDKSCYLAVDDPSNIVAKGTIVKHNVSVTVDTSVQSEALIPNPIPEEFVETVKDAIGYMLSWPSHLVIPCSGLNKIIGGDSNDYTDADFDDIREEWAIYVSNSFLGRNRALFIKPLKDDKSKEAKKQLYTPPGKYPSVNKKDWKLFVSQRTKPSFEAITQKASANRQRNKYNHRLSRKGYAGLISEIMEETGKEEEEIDRAECWKKAREKKTGGFDPDVQKIVDKIEQLKKDKDYSDDPMRTIDLLIEALGTVEQRGRVRGIGRFVTPNQYFLIPRNVKQYLKQYDNMMNKRLKAVEDELASRRSRCASTNASEGGSNSPTLSDEDEPPNVPTERNDKSCYLAVDDPLNIVAKGTIVKHTGSAVEDELARRRSRCASTNASEGGSNSPTLSDEDEPPNVPIERNVTMIGIDNSTADGLKSSLVFKKMESGLAVAVSSISMEDESARQKNSAAVDGDEIVEPYGMKKNEQLLINLELK